MNKYLRHIIFTFGLALSFSIAFAQAPLESIGNSFGAGNVGGISRHFDNAVSLSIPGSQATYSRSQAEMVLRDFFNKNAPKGMSIEHNGENNSGSYAIGTLVTSNGNYRTYFALRQKESGYFIQEIRIER
jgi:hypothetical protein